MMCCPPQQACPPGILEANLKAFSVRNPVVCDYKSLLKQCELEHISMMFLIIPSFNYKTPNILLSGKLERKVLLS